MYPTAFSIFLLDVKWASHTYHAQLKTLALLIPNDFSIIFLVYMNDSSIFQHLKPINLKSNPSLLFFSLSLPDPIQQQIIWVLRSISTQKPEQSLITDCISPIRESFQHLLLLSKLVSTMISKTYQIRLPIITSSHALVLSGFAHSCQPQLFTLISYTQKEHPYLSDFAFAVPFPQNFLPHIFTWLTPLPCSCLSPVSPSGRVLTDHLIKNQPFTHRIIYIPLSCFVFLASPFHQLPLIRCIWFILCFLKLEISTRKAGYSGGEDFTHLQCLKQYL